MVWGRELREGLKNVGKAGLEVVSCSVREGSVAAAEAIQSAARTTGDKHQQGLLGMGTNIALGVLGAAVLKAGVRYFR